MSLQTRLGMLISSIGADVKNLGLTKLDVTKLDSGLSGQVLTKTSATSQVYSWEDSSTYYNIMGVF